MWLKALLYSLPTLKPSQEQQNRLKARKLRFQLIWSLFDALKDKSALKTRPLGLKSFGIVEEWGEFTTGIITWGFSGRLNMKICGSRLVFAAQAWNFGWC